MSDILATPGLEAGSRGRRLRRFLPPRAHINSLIQASGRTVLDRARFLARNNAYAANALDYWSGQIVGTGIVPAWKKLPDAAMKAALSDAWLRWTDEADAEGLTDLYGLQRRAARELFIAGEVFLRQRLRRPEDGLSVPLQLQMLPSEMLPVDDNRDLGNGNFVRQGIEFDQIGRRVAYWFYQAHPDDSTATRGRVIATLQTRVPAEQVLHIVDPVEGGQLRGISRLAPAIVPLWLLDLYDDAELDRKRTAALYAVFRKQNPEFDPRDDGAEDEGEGVAAQELVPGAQILLDPGEEIQVAAPADVGGSYEAFQYRALLRAAAGCGVPYTGLTGDMVRANYSNLRGDMLQFRRKAQAFQHHVMVFQFCRPVMAAWLPLAGIAGAVPAAQVSRSRASMGRVEWVPPSWDWVDPSKDVAAARAEVDAGFRSRASVIIARGEDPEAVDQEIAEERQREQRLKLAETPSSFAPAKGAPQQSVASNFGPKRQADSAPDDESGDPPQED